MAAVSRIEAVASFCPLSFILCLYSGRLLLCRTWYKDLVFFSEPFFFLFQKLFCCGWSGIFNRFCSPTGHNSMSCRVLRSLSYLILNGWTLLLKERTRFSTFFINHSLYVSVSLWWFRSSTSSCRYLSENCFKISSSIGFILYHTVSVSSLFRIRVSLPTVLRNLFSCFLEYDLILSQKTSVGRNSHVFDVNWQPSSVICFI